MKDSYVMNNETINKIQIGQVHQNKLELHGRG